MKKLIILLFAMVLLLGCTSNQKAQKTDLQKAVANNSQKSLNITNESLILSDEDINELFSSDLDKAITDLESVENLSD